MQWNQFYLCPIFLILFCLSYFFIRITSHDFFVNEMNNCNIVLQLFCVERQNLFLPQPKKLSGFQSHGVTFLSYSHCFETWHRNKSSRTVTCFLKNPKILNLYDDVLKKIIHLKCLGGAKMLGRNRFVTVLWHCWFRNVTEK